MARMKRWVKKHGKELIVDVIIGGFVVGLITTGLLFIWISTLDIPDLSAFEERQILQSTKIYDRTGEVLLYDLHQDVKRTVVEYDQMSRHIKNATIAIEDDTFFEHWGVRPLAIVRAALSNLQGGDLRGQGGSTITQQVIKNSILEREKTITRKIKEAILAIRLEQVLTKEEILTHYLNESPYGGTIYGVEEASLSFFGKKANDVTLAEAAYLAALPQAPTYFSPYGANRDNLDLRKNRVLNNMLSLGFINEEEYTTAKAEVVEFKPQIASGIRAPHFVFYVRDYLARRYGEEQLAERGFRVITTLDWDLQEAAETIVLEKALHNESAFNAENAALVAADPQTGEILTMVGSRDYFDTEIDGNFNIAIAERQPGSSFKPFVYATAFNKGYTPDTVVFDLKTQFSTACEADNFTSEGECYSPTNYDNQFRGPVTLKNALAQSLNIPAVKTLYLAGLHDSFKLARDLGISTLTNPDQYGLTLVLGGGEVQLVEMVGAYGVFANKGVKADLHSIARIEDSTGNIIEEFEPRDQQVLNEQVALQVSDVLSDNVARTPLYGANSLMRFPGRDVAAKTGTTNDRRDAWIVGYTPNLVVGAWAGNNDNSTMNELSGLIITPLWREFMDVAVASRTQETFEEPVATPTNAKPVLRGVWFDPAMLVTEELVNSDEVEEENNENVDEDQLPNLTLENTLGGAHSILFYVDKDDPNGPYPSNPQSDGQFSLWEYPVTLWKANLLGLTNSEEDEGTDEDEDDS